MKIQGENSAHVFIHQGASWYLPYTLRTCLKSDPGTRVILIGEKNDSAKIEFANIADFRETPAVREFNLAYIHLSTNPEDYEKFCFQRWFYLLELMRRRGLDSVLHHDSDVLFLSTLDRVRKAYGESLDYAAVCMVPDEDIIAVPRLHTSGHSSYWTRPALEDFCRFLIQSYVENEHREELLEMWRQYKAVHPSGGICDMTLISNFVHSSPGRVGNLLEIRNASSFDPGLHLGHGSARDIYQMENGVKVIQRNGDDYFFVREKSGEAVKALAIHFQGENKKLIPDYYRGGFDWGIWRERLKRNFEESIFKKAEKKIRKLRKNLFKPGS